MLTMLTGVFKMKPPAQALLQPSDVTETQTMTAATASHFWSNSGVLSFKNKRACISSSTAPHKREKVDVLRADTCW